MKQSQNKFRELYHNIVKSDWFKNSHDNKSIGDEMELED